MLIIVSASSTRYQQALDLNDPIPSAALTFVPTHYFVDWPVPYRERPDSKLCRMMTLAQAGIQGVGWMSVSGVPEKAELKTMEFLSILWNEENMKARRVVHSSN